MDFYNGCPFLIPIFWGDIFVILRKMYEFEHKKFQK